MVVGYLERELRERVSHHHYYYNTLKVLVCQDIFKASFVVSSTLLVQPLPKVSKVDNFS